MLLLALQTTTSAAGDSRIDTLTLVLVVIFIASMLALVVVDAPPGVAMIPSEPASDARQPEEFVQSSIAGVTACAPGSIARAPRARSVPVWLQGVSLPGDDASLSDATSVIEALLTARRDHDLAAGLALYPPGTRASLAKQLGIDLSSPRKYSRMPRSRAIHRHSDQQRSSKASGARMTVRATYSSGSSENYTLTWLDGAWLIEEITASR